MSILNRVHRQDGIFVQGWNLSRKNFIFDRPLNNYGNKYIFLLNYSPKKQDLTSIAEEEDFPDSGHEGVIEQLEAVLKLPTRRNAILKGPPGSGKSTIAKILAQKIVKDQLGPDSPFKGKRILSTNLTAFFIAVPHIEGSQRQEPMNWRST